MWCRSIAFCFFCTLQALNISANASEQADWQAFMAAEKQAFTSFQSEHDKAFTDFLTQHWQAYEVFNGKTRDLRPKPAKAPQAKNNLFTVHTKPTPAQANKPAQPHTHFFGHKVAMLPLLNTALPSLAKPSKKDLAKVWQTFSSHDHQRALADIKQAKTNLALGDWSLYLYLQQQVSQHYQEPKQQVSYLWFLLNKLGYHVKLAFDNAQVYLLIASSNTIYGKTFVQMQGQTYYLIGTKQDSSPLYSYPGHYQSTNRPMTVNFEPLLETTKAEQVRRLAFEYQQQRQHVVISFDPMRSLLLDSYPQLDLEHYFRAKPSPNTATSIREALRPVIANLPKREALNHLLRLTQMGFHYAKDDQQFGEENYLLLEESLNYGTNDCEDRSVFLAWLIKDLMQLEVVALDYPGHVALAVALQPKAKDATVQSRGKTYVVADPTYIGADVGMAMPAFAQQQPKVIHY